MRQHKLEYQERQRLVKVLLSFREMEDLEGRKGVVKDLDSEISIQIKEDIAALDHVDEMVQTCMRYPGGLEALLKRVKDHEPNSYAYAELLTIEETWNTEQATQSAQEGLQALGDLMRDRRVIVTVGAFKAIFDTTSNQIDTLAHYKDVHDLLHTLQFQLVNSLKGFVRRTKKEINFDVDWDDSMQWEDAVENTFQVLEKLEARAAQRKYAIRWIDDLSCNLRALLQAIKDRQIESLEAALKPIESTVAKEPAGINIRLTEAARALPLRPLSRALRDIAEKLGPGQVNPPAMDKLKEGAEALNELSGTLDPLIEDHDRWQHIDDILSRIEPFMRIDTSELLMEWQFLRQETLAQCKGAVGEWAKKLSEESQKLDKAISDPDQGNIRQSFERYHSRIRIRFYQVDSSLKELCERLRRTSEPLASVMELL